MFWLMYLDLLKQRESLSKREKGLEGKQMTQRYDQDFKM